MQVVAKDARTLAQPPCELAVPAELAGLYHCERIAADEMPHWCTLGPFKREHTMLGGRFCNRPELQKRAGNPTENSTTVSGMRSLFVPIAALVRMKGCGGKDGTCWQT